MQCQQISAGDLKRGGRISAHRPAGKTIFSWAMALMLPAVLAAPISAAAEETVAPEPQPAQEQKINTSESKFTEMDFFAIPYGFAASAIDIHVYLSLQYWNYQPHALGKYANQGASNVGRSDIIPYSGYIDLASKVHRELKVEAEFELYKGGGTIKVTKLRGLWQPDSHVGFSFGRDFGIVGLQEKLYYPTSKFKLFTIPPFLHMNVIRYTGWWDSGAFVYGNVPFPFFSDSGKIYLDASVSNGPGMDSTETVKENGVDVVKPMVRPNSQGYMFEHFHDIARQSTDNNQEKPIAGRISISPWTDFEFGASYLAAKWDPRESQTAQYIFSHFLMQEQDLTLVAEYGQLKFTTAALGYVTQFSGYAAAGYTVLKDLPYIRFLQPVARYEIMDSWKEDPTRKGYRTSVSAGVRYSPLPGWVIKMAYQVTTEPYGPSLDNDGFATEMVFEF